MTANPTTKQMEKAHVLRLFALVILCSTVALYAVATVLAGGSATGLLLYPLAFLLVLLLPGLALCELFLPRASTAERWAIALPVGGLLLMLSFSLLGWRYASWAGLYTLPCVCLGLTHFGGKALRRFTGLYQSPRAKTPFCNSSLHSRAGNVFYKAEYLSRVFEFVGKAWYTIKLE